MQEAQRATKQGVCRLDVVAGKIAYSKYYAPTLGDKKWHTLLNLLATVLVILDFWGENGSNLAAISSKTIKTCGNISESTKCECLMIKLRSVKVYILSFQAWLHVH